MFADRVTALAFSPDGKLLATGGGEPSRAGELKLFNVADGTLARAIAEAHSDTVFGLEFSPDGKYLASSAADRFVKVFKVADGKLSRVVRGAHASRARRGLEVRRQSAGQRRGRQRDQGLGLPHRRSAAHRKPASTRKSPRWPSWAPQPKVLASSGDKTVRLVNTDNGKMERTYSGSQDFMYSTATSADGRLAVSGGQDSTLFVWLVDGEAIRGSVASYFDAITIAYLWDQSYVGSHSGSSQAIRRDAASKRS